MKINRDFFDNPIVPDYILCKANKERIGVLQCTEKNIDFKFDDLDEINFTTHLYIDGEKNPIYEDVDVMKYILLPNVGFFSITSVNIHSEGSDFESKSVTAKSYECLLAQKYLENFVINMGTAESIDGIRFYNIREKDKSLIHLVLEKCPDWEIGHIDASLMTMQRSFEISRQDIYSFLCTEVSKAFECFFLFDTLNNTINIYREDNVGKNTNIHVSYINLLKNTNLSCSTDNIKTCLTLTGSDDLTVRELNMGYDKIYNFCYYNSTEFMSQKLYTAYNKWITLWNSQLPLYTSLLSQYQEYYKQINYLTHKKMPSVTGSTEWTEYGLQPLKEQLAAYEKKQAISMKAGHGDSSSPFYISEYLPIYNSILAINAQLKVLEDQIKALKDQQSPVSDQMSAIISKTAMENNFTTGELSELTTFIREDELNNSNYVVTDSMSDDDRFEMLNDMLKFGQNELARASAPQLSFSANMINLFAIPEFDPFYDDFEPGNYIWVTLRDDFSVKAKLLSMHVNFYDTTDFSVSFGNIVRKAKTRYSDFTDMIKTAADAATSVSFNSSYWSQAAKDSSTISKMLADGLLSAGNYLSSGGDNADFLIDSRGLFVNTVSGKYAGKDSIFIGGGRILFTDDNWKTVRMSVGRADVKINGKTESYFGTFADFVIAGYIGGSTLEGDDIIGGTITGSRFNNGNGTFSVDENGVLSAARGRIGCDRNGNGGFIIDSNKLYSGKDSITSDKSGVYLGTDGIALGANSTFKVDNLGNLTAVSANVTGRITANEGYIGGSVIANDSIHASNGNWWINSDGSASFKNVTVSGASSSLNIGGGFGLTGLALNHFNDLVANKVTANYIDVTVKLTSTYATIENLESTTLRVETLEGDHVSMKTFTALSGKVDTIESTYITAKKVKADYMEVKNWTTGEYIDANKIAANSIGADKISLQNNPASWCPISVVTDVSAIKDENGFVIGINTHKNNIWFLGKNNF